MENNRLPVGYQVDLVEEGETFASLMNIRDPYRKIAVLGKNNIDSISNHFVQSPGQLLNAPRQSLATRENIANSAFAPNLMASNHDQADHPEEPQILLTHHHQRCESGSTGYSYPEPAAVAGNQEQMGLPRQYARHDKRVDTQNADKPKKKVQFRNVATEPDLSEFNEETSIIEQDSHGVSREDTMVEHSLAVNEEAIDKADYLQAIQSAKFDHDGLSSSKDQNHHGETSDYTMAGKDGSSGGGASKPLKNNFVGFSREEDQMIEKTLMQIRDRIRKGQPLSHQIALNNSDQERPIDVDSEQSSTNSDKLRVSETQYSREETSENVKSSGMEQFRVSKVPIGAVVKMDTNESSNLGMALSSKPSHKNNNLSKKEIFAMHPKQALSLMCHNQASRKTSPTGILKQPKLFSGEQSIDSIESHNLDQVRKQFKQPSLPASRRQETRIQESVTYSPVSHCVTRDAANIFEKKKQRMAKIQKLRGASNQSEPNRIVGEQEQVVQNVTALQSRNNRQKSDLILSQQQKKQPTSLPQTPRDPFLNKLVQKIRQVGGSSAQTANIDVEQNNSAEDIVFSTAANIQQQNGSKFYSNNSKAPPVTHAQNSVQKQKSKPQMLIQQQEEMLLPQKPQRLGKQANEISPLEQNLINFYMQPSESSSSVVDQQQQQMQAMLPPKAAATNTSKFKSVTSTTSSKPGRANLPKSNTAFNRLFTEATQQSSNSQEAAAIQLAALQQQFATSACSAKPAVLPPSRPKSSNLAANQQNHHAVGHSQNKSTVATGGLRTKQKFHTERSTQELPSMLAIDPFILRKLKALNQQQQDLAPQKASTNFTNTQNRGGLLSKESSASVKKQRDAQRMTGKQAPTSKHMASQGVSQLISNFMSQGKQQTSLLQKEQILFLLEHLSKDENSQAGKTMMAAISNYSQNSSSQNHRSRYNSGHTKKAKVERHQRCESGSTGYEPAATGGNQETPGLPRSFVRHDKRVETQNADKPKKKVQFRNVATEPDLSEFNETSIVEQDSHGVSREDTMVEHSIAVNEEANEKADYLQALQSAKFDQYPMRSDPADQSSGECQVEQGNGGQFTKEEENMIERTLMQIRDRIRSGLPLSHQVNQYSNCDDNSEVSRSNSQQSTRIKISQCEYSREETSENVKSSGMENFRKTKAPIGATTAAVNLETTESSNLGLALSSKPSHKNNNLSKKQIFAMHPKQALSLMCHNQRSRKTSPTGILKQPKMFSGEQSIDSIESHLDQVRKQFKQPALPASRRYETRIHQSVTYSPVSHCVTRDAANIFEKKKQRMANIQKLRGASNQSEADKQILICSSAENFQDVPFSAKLQDDSSSVEHSKRLVRLQETSMCSLEQMNQLNIQKKKSAQSTNMVVNKRKHPISQPLTPRKFNIENILQRLTAAGAAGCKDIPVDRMNDMRDKSKLNGSSQQKNNLSLNNKKLLSKAPPVTGQNSNAQNSNQKKKKGSQQRNRVSSAVSDSKQQRTNSSQTRQGLVSKPPNLGQDTTQTSLDKHLINFLLNPSNSSISIETKTNVQQKLVMNINQNLANKGQQNSKQIQATKTRTEASKASEKGKTANEQLGEPSLMKQFKQQKAMASKRQHQKQTAVSSEHQQTAAPKALLINLTQRSGGQNQQQAAGFKKHHQPHINPALAKKHQKKKQSYQNSNSSTQDLLNVVLRQAVQKHDATQIPAGVDQAAIAMQKNQMTLNLQQQKQASQTGVSAQKPSNRSNRKQNQTVYTGQSVTELNNLLVANFMNSGNASNYGQSHSPAGKMPPAINFFVPAQNLQHLLRQNVASNYKTAIASTAQQQQAQPPMSSFMLQKNKEKRRDGDRSKRTSIHNISALVNNNTSGNQVQQTKASHKGTTASVATNRSQFIQSSNATQLQHQRLYSQNNPGVKAFSGSRRADQRSTGNGGCAVDPGNQTLMVSQGFIVGSQQQNSTMY